MKIYLDNNRATPVDDLVFEEMQPLIKEPYGDLHTPHYAGAKTRKLYNKAVEKIYASLNASDKDNIIFTSNSAESNSTLFMGIYFDYILTGRKNSIIISDREPLSILQLADFLELQGCKVDRIPVGKEGVFEPELLYDYITPRTALVSVSMVDSETGAINPIEEIGAICKKYDVPFHTDATYAMGKIEVDVSSLNIDFLSFSSETLHAPAGTGVLWLKEGRDISPLIQGTRYPAQMSRGGILNLSGIVGLGKAVEIANDALNFEMEDVRELRDHLEEEILKIDEVISLVPWSLRVPNTLFVAVKGVESESLLYHLNREGIALYSFSINPCGEWDRKNIIETMKLDPILKHSTVGFALSRMNREEEIERTLKIFREKVEFLREIGAVKIGVKNG